MKTIRELVANRIKPEWLDKTAKEFIMDRYKKANVKRSPDGLRWYVVNFRHSLGYGFSEDAAWELAVTRIIFNDK